MQSATMSPSKGFRFPQEIISHAVWLYFRFSLSYRDVQELLFARGVTVSYETVRQWCRTLGQQYANQLRRRRPHPAEPAAVQPRAWRARLAARPAPHARRRHPAPGPRSSCQAAARQASCSTAFACVGSPLQITTLRPCTRKDLPCRRTWTRTGAAGC